MEALFSVRAGTGWPARWDPLFRPARLVSPGGRGAGPHPGPAIGLLERCHGATRRGHQLRAFVSGQGPRAGPGQQAPPRAQGRLESRSRRRPQPRRRRLARLEKPPHLAGRRSRCRLRRRPPPGAHRLPQRTQGPRAHCPGQAEPPRLRRAGRVPARRRLLLQPRIRHRVQAAREGTLPRGRVQAPAPFRRPPVWRAKHLLTPGAYPLWGIEHGCRTVVIYSPKDLSCYWNQAERSPTNTAVILATRVGQNIVDYATGRELPADKLVVREVHDFKVAPVQRNALRIAKLQHAGQWNVAPLAVPNLMEALRKPPLSFDVVINHKELLPRDPSLIYYPLIYLHGRAAFSFTKEDLDALRRHLEPGGGTLFGDSACGSPAFDAAFRRFATELLPNNPLVPIPRDEELYSTKVGFDLADSQYTK